MEPQAETDMLWGGLRQNILAGTRLALFLPVRALDFSISIGQYVALVFASLAFWLGGGMLRASLGTYTVATMISGSLCIVAAVMVLRINKESRSVQAVAT